MHNAPDVFFVVVILSNQVFASLSHSLNASLVGRQLGCKILVLLQLSLQIGWILCTVKTSEYNY